MRDIDCTSQGARSCQIQPTGIQVKLLVSNLWPEVSSSPANLNPQSQLLVIDSCEKKSSEILNEKGDNIYNYSS